MKTTLIKVLTSSVTSLALCATAAACGPGGGGGGGYRPNPYPYSNNVYPSQYSAANRGLTTNKIAPVTVKPQQVATTAATVPAVPQARITTVSDSAPVGRLQIAPAVDTTAKTTVATKPEEISASTKAAIEEKLAALKTDGESSTSISEALKGLTGTWMAVSRQGDGELSTVELQLDDHGWAKLTVPGSDGKSSTTTRKAELENNELKLTGGDADIMLGKLVEFNSRQMVLERSGSQVTFVRP